MVSRCFPGGYNVKLCISRGRLAWWLLGFCVVCGSSLHGSDLAIDVMESLYTMLSKHSEAGFANFPIIIHSVYSGFIRYIFSSRVQCPHSVQHFISWTFDPDREFIKKCFDSKRDMQVGNHTKLNSAPYSNCGFFLLHYVIFNQHFFCHNELLQICCRFY